MMPDVKRQLRGYGEQLDEMRVFVGVDDVLEEWIGPAPVRPLRLREPEGRRLGLAVAVASAVLVLLLVGGATWLVLDSDIAPVITEPPIPTTIAPSTTTVSPTTVPDSAFLPLFNVADVPAFQATVSYDRNPDGLPDLGLPRGATAVVEFSFAAPERVRRQIVEMSGPRVEESPEPGAGSYVIAADGKIVEYNADADAAREVLGGFDVLGELFWGARWQARCDLGEVEPLPDDTVAGRDAQHLRCRNLAGEWEFWIDREIGIVLKMNGELPENSPFFGSSPQGGFEVTSIEFVPTFAANLFELPPVEVDELVPGADGSVHLTYATHYQDQNFDNVVREVWYDPDRGTRIDVLGGSGLEWMFASGSYSVWADGELQWYDASRDTYGSEAIQSYDIGLPQQDPDPAGCERVEEQLISREVTHLSCSYPPPRDGEEWWIDNETGLVLRLTLDQQPVFEVTSLETEPAFPGDIFDFTPPPGSIPNSEYSVNPWNHVNLIPGELAPVWRGPLVGVGELSLADLHGKPTLILFWWTWDVDFSLPAARDFQEIYDTWQNQVNLVSVPLHDDQETIRSVLDQGDLTYPTVSCWDPDGGCGDAITDDWGINSGPLWVLLDGEGRAIDTRLPAEASIEEFDEMLAAITSEP